MKSICEGDAPLYEEIRLPSLADPVFVTEIGGDLLVDMRSLAIALKLDRQVAEMGLLLANRKFGASEGLDRNGVAIVLLPVSRIQDWLAWPHHSSNPISTNRFVQVWNYEWPRAWGEVRERMRKQELSNLMRERAAQAVAARRARAAAKQAAQAEAPPKSATGGRPRPGSVPYQPPVKPRRTRLADRPPGPTASLERPGNLPDWLDWRDGATVITARLIRVLWTTRGREGPAYKPFSLSDSQVVMLRSGRFPGGDPALREAWLETFGAPQHQLDR